MTNNRAAFDFAEKLQAFADEQGVRISSMRVGTPTRRFNTLSVLFSMKSKPPRRETTEKKPVEADVEPDEDNTDEEDAQTDEPVAERLETIISELEEELDTTKKDEV